MTVTTSSIVPDLARVYSSAAVFLLGSISLVVDSGYSYGAALLLLGGIYALSKNPRMALRVEDVWILGVVIAFGAVGMLEAAIHHGGGRALDKPVRFLLAAVALWLVRKYPPRLSWLWAGLAVGGILTACWSGYQKIALGVDRA